MRLIDADALLDSRDITHKCKNCPLAPDICHGGKPDCDIRDNEIMASWDAHDFDDISTERLLQMVADDCKCEVDDVVETLSRQQDRRK